MVQLSTSLAEWDFTLFLLAIGIPTHTHTLLLSGRNFVNNVELFAISKGRGDQFKRSKSEWGNEFLFTCADHLR
jgi:hypothetical protein